MGIISNKIRYTIYVICTIAFILFILDLFYNFGFSFMYAFFIIVASGIIFFIDEVISIKLSKPPYLTPKERKMKKLYEKNYITAAVLKTGWQKRIGIYS